VPCLASFLKGISFHNASTAHSYLQWFFMTVARCAPTVAHTVQCPYCIDAYTQASLEKGSNVEEMTEAVHVACAIRGGASLVHGVQMRNVIEKLSM
jgi:alkylhydroperoxidase/carboxymuconolactone decarboxylase family protein